MKNKMAMQSHKINSCTTRSQLAITLFTTMKTEPIILLSMEDKISQDGLVQLIHSNDTGVVTFLLGFGMQI
jgi:hypothetical protein